MSEFVGGVFQASVFQNSVYQVGVEVVPEAPGDEGEIDPRNPDTNPRRRTQKRYPAGQPGGLRRTNPPGKRGR